MRSRRPEWLRRELGDRTMTVLSRAEVAETGSTSFAGGVLQRRLGRAASAQLPARAGRRRRPPRHPHLRRHAGAAHPARGRRRAGGDAGRQRARRRVVLATSYSDRTWATDALRRRIVPFRSAIIATER
jgi:hypothetical protein